MAIRFALVALGAVLTPSLAASADLTMTASELRATGTVGEKATGYMATVPGATLTDEQRRAMDQINIQRRALHTQRARETGSTVAQFSQFTACAIFKRLKPGDAYRDEENVWREVDDRGAVLPTWCALP